MNKHKYPSTKHVPWSPSVHRDDSVCDDLSVFENANEVIITEKMDGENCSLLSNGDWHARSLDTVYHASRTWAARVAGEVGYKLPNGWRVCAENLYATHSIRYTNLRSYVQVFSIWNENNEALSWDDTVEWCRLLELTHVPVIYRGSYHDKEHVMSAYNQYKNEVNREVEGWVMRTSDSFSYDKFNVVKYVREDHVQTDDHWLQNWERDGQINELKSEPSE